MDQAKEEALRDVFFKMYEDNIVQARHHETQRTAVATVLLAIVSAIIGLVSKESLDPNQLPLTLLVIVIGVLGAVLSAKQYERFNFHMQRARYYRAALDSILPDDPITVHKDGKSIKIGGECKYITTLKKEADKEHFTKYKAFKKIEPRLNWLWTLIYVVVAVLGVVLSLIAWYHAGK